MQGLHLKSASYFIDNIKEKYSHPNKFTRCESSQNHAYILTFRILWGYAYLSLLSLSIDTNNADN